MYITAFLLALISCFGVSIMATNECPSGWRTYNRKYSSSCYLDLPVKQTQPEAKATCKALGGFLAEPRTKDENEFISRKSGPKLRRFIGFNDRKKEGSFYGDHSEEGLGYTNWAIREPNNYRKIEDCVELDFGKKTQWNDIPCHYKLHAVCQINLPCPRNWKAHGGNCYYLSKEKATYCEAQARCNKIGGYVAEPRNQCQNKFVSGLSYKERMWIGLTDLATEKIFRWDSNKDLLGHFKAWGKNEPNNYKNNEHCTETNFGKQATWNDIHCHAKFRYVCQMKQH